MVVINVILNHITIYSLVNRHITMVKINIFLLRKLTNFLWPLLQWQTVDNFSQRVILQSIPCTYYVPIIYPQCDPICIISPQDGAPSYKLVYHRINYRHIISTISPSEIGVMCSNLANELGHHLACVWRHRKIRRSQQLMETSLRGVACSS